MNSNQHFENPHEIDLPEDMPVTELEFQTLIREALDVDTVSIFDEWEVPIVGVSIDWSDRPDISQAAQVIINDGYEYGKYGCLWASYQALDPGKDILWEDSLTVQQSIGVGLGLYTISRYVIMIACITSPIRTKFAIRFNIENEVHATGLRALAHSGVVFLHPIGTGVEDFRVFDINDMSFNLQGLTLHMPVSLITDIMDTVGLDY